ncbi:macrolide-specific efflux system membrane fusion protein [Duganella sp. 1224]|uniref:efflux RND transporter periplasmic adaptor subunit n=1 Tax=Duganella sp. 1224 TaxID=2587052 RepID=UPI00178F6D04|nr:efflux RND transporter periplasmic adaptor subunit [Duganella sp. 1224]NYE59922.1 macrolide-specific efflux system membrane fusion protein [Duganella sp. 1224]
MNDSQAGARRPTRLTAATLVLALTAPLSFAQALNAPAAPPQAAPAVESKLDTITVQRGDLQQTVDAIGKLQFRQFADVNVQVAGQIKEVLFAVGDAVREGQPVMEISPTVRASQVESNRAQMARLRAELADQQAQTDFAELQFKRQTQLKAQNATRDESVESSRMNLSSARARVDAINAQIQQLEATLKSDEENSRHKQVLAPLSGTVVALNARAGQTVGAGQPGAPLMRIADLSQLTVQARVAEVDVTRLKRGMTANFQTPGYPGRTWSGKLRQVLPVPADGTAEQGKQTFYNVLFDVDNPEQELMSGMTAQVQFVVAQAKDALLLPVNLLGKRDATGMYEVHVVNAERRIVTRKVKIGVRTAQQAQVLSGLDAGEQVLVGPVPTPALQPRPAATVGAP